MVIVGAAFWGTVGLYVQNLDQYGFQPVDMASTRLIIAGLVLAGYLRFTDPGVLRINRLRDVLLFVGTGSFSIALFNLSYFASINEIGMSLAVVLIYTGPGFVIILGRIWFREPITLIKVASLMVMFTGVALVSDIRPTGIADVSATGIFLGVAAGAAFSFYNLIGKYALRHYSAQTVVVYTFLFAGFTLLPFSGMHEKYAMLFTPGPALWMVGMVVFPTLLAYLFYTAGLNRMEAGRASIVGVSEILMAVVIGITVFGDSLSLYQSAGMLLVILAMFLIRK